MKKNLFSKAGIFNPRIFAAFVLVTFGVSLGVFSFAAPKPASRKSTGKTTAPFQPTVIQSIFNGESAPIRDMPSTVVPKESGEPEHDLPRVKPYRAVPATFVDAARQSIAAIAAAPAPNLTFEGQSSVD